MNPLPIALLGTAFLCAVMAGCKDDKPAAPPPAPTTPAPKVGAGGDTHAGPKHELGIQQAGGYTIKATQFGTVKPRAETVFELAISGGSEKPSDVRVWVGNEAADGSVKSRPHVHGDVYDAHVEVPEKLPDNSKLWVEVTRSGSKSTTVFSFKQ